MLRIAIPSIFVLMVMVFPGYALAEEMTHPDPIFEDWGDGRAFVVGQVIDRIHGCEYDGACSLELKVKDKQIYVIYAEGDVPRPIGRVGFHGGDKGEWIKAFGAYSKRGKEEVISMIGSTDYFVLDASDGTPLGPVTERFFDRVSKLKGR